MIDRMTLLLVLAPAIAMTSACSNSNNNSPDELTTTNPLQDSSMIDATIHALLENNPVPGMAVAIISNAENPVIWSKGYGVTNIETAAPVTEHTSCWMGSVSKAVMGTAIMVAEEKGLLRLDDDVSALVPATGGFSIDNLQSDAISLQHLASHTSGIIDNDDKYICAYYVNNDDGSQTKLANLFDVGIDCPEHVANTLPGFLAAYLSATGEYYDSANNFSTATPGDTYDYSNIGAGLAGYALELATGQTLAEYALAEIFTPLAMPDTSWRYEDLNPANVATPYTSEDDEPVPLPNYELATWPDGGLRSSAVDMARLLATIMNDGTFGQSGVSILQPASVTRMLTPTSDGYSLFWEVNDALEYGGEQHTINGHTGSDPGAFSVIYFDPEQHIGVVIVATGDDEEIDEQAFLDLIKLMFESGELLGR
ncbi:MAG: serine hydrolase domain-containing protein [Granulosicoccus sp.]